MNGILVIDKPKNYTSFDVVAVVRKLLGIKKIGHTGTLDPMATGVLPILIGKATKIQSLISDNKKEYIASFKLGITTDTLDITGKILSQTLPHIEKSTFEKALNQFKGNIKQIPPIYSAVQKNGVRLYHLARKGIEIEREPRDVCIYNLELISFDEVTQEGIILVNCSKGTYIRSLCDDIGKVLKCGATLTELKRIKSSYFKIEDSITLSEAKDLFENGKLASKILPCDVVLKDYKKIFISSAQSIRFKNGGALSLDRTSLKHCIIKNDDLIRIYDNEKKFIGLGKVNLEKNELCVSNLMC